MGASEVWPSAVAWLAIVVGLAAVVSSSEAYVFHAGGRDGWVLAPTESYNHWAGRNRFQVNDTIVFTHEEGVDLVLLVTEQDFDTCNTRNPVRRLQAVGGSGSSAFRFDRSGLFFFISSDEDRCQKGQKLYIVVMAAWPAVAVAPAPDDTSQWAAAFPPASAAAPPPLWAPAPDYAQAPSISALGDSGDEESRGSSLGAPPPTAGASRLVDEMVIAPVVGLVGVLVLCAMLE